MELSVTLDRLHAEGRSAWPDVEVQRDAFAAFLRERAPEEADLGSLQGADLYLACACAAQDARALSAFETRYMAEVPAFLTRVERSPAVIDEICQLVRAKLFVAREGTQPKILEYSGRGSLASWLRVVTLRVASNRRRGERRQIEFDGDVSPTELLPAVDPELAVIRTRYGAAFNEALRRAFEGLTARERLLFRMHFLDGLNIESMGVMFRVHRATVARWLVSAREAVLERTMTLLGDQLELDARELASLLLVVRSALDVSLQGLLSAGEEKK